jgi:hypothetical protein
MQTDDTARQDQEVQALLKDYPMPTATTAFYDQAVARATHEGTRRQRNRWLMTGFGSAIAAGLVLWFIGGFFLAAPFTPAANPDIPGVTMTLEEPRTINLVFASASALDSALLTVTLPDGIELAGFPEQREIAWRTSLNKGRNFLPLELVAVSPGGGDVLARLEHNDRDRTFRLHIDVS